jgi:hypothetical protein
MCSKEAMSKKFRGDLKKINKTLDINKCSLIEGQQYINAREKLKFACSICGNIFEKSYAELKRRGGCKCIK